jgi:hypothetical protein
MTRKTGKNLNISAFAGFFHDVLADQDQAMYPNRPEIGVIRVRD